LEQQGKAAAQRTGSASGTVTEPDSSLSESTPTTTTARGRSKLPLKVTLRSVRLWVGLAISALTLFLLLRGITWDDVIATLLQVQIQYVVLALLTVLVTIAAKVERWRLLFWPQHRQVHWVRLFFILLAGQLINFAFPGRLGDVARVYYVGQDGQVRHAHVVTTIAVEKMLDLIMTLALLALLLPLMSVPGWLQDSTQGLLGITFLLLLVLVTMTLMGQRIFPLLTWPLRLLPHRFQEPARHHLELAMEGLKALRQGRILAGVAFWSIVAWTSSVITNYLVFLGFELVLPWQAALFLLLVLMLGSAVPSSPGKVGVFHYLTVLGLIPFGVGKPVALGIALVLYGVVYSPPLVGGSVFLTTQ